jgi:hypothetical protein
MCPEHCQGAPIAESGAGSTVAAGALAVAVLIADPALWDARLEDGVPDPVVQAAVASSS